MPTKNISDLISLRGVSKVYGEGQAELYALRSIDLDVDPGEFVAIMGPSGSGKSTCMNLLGFLDEPTSGIFYFKKMVVGSLDRDQKALIRRNYLGFIFQGFNLLNRTTAIENVELPLVYQGVAKEDRRGLAEKSLAAVGLAGWEDHTPGELSGGQQQRVAIARALVTEPALILADEPTGNLDSAMSVEIMSLLKKFNEELGITIVMVTHEDEMAAHAGRVIHFRDGRITDGEDH